MPNETISLAGSWCFAGWGSAAGYFGLAFLAALAIRFVLAILKGLEALPGAWDDFLCAWKGAFGGFSPRESHRDHWVPFVLGFLEISVFPFLVRKDAWTFVAAWIAFKTVAQWDQWKVNRSAFNRFLIGTILTVAASVLLAWGFLGYPLCG